mgnify:CR=1 FL=1
MPVVRGKDIEVLFSASTIARRNLELAKEIGERHYDDLLVISILKGSFVFAADLIRAMHDTGLSPEVEFIFISSYGAGTVSGEVKVLRDIENDVAGRDILLIDDSIVRGTTSKRIIGLLRKYGAKEITLGITCPPHRHAFLHVDDDAAQAAAHAGRVARVAESDPMAALDLLHLDVRKAGPAQEVADLLQLQRLEYDAGALAVRDRVRPPADARRTGPVEPAEVVRIRGLHYDVAGRGIRRHRRDHDPPGVQAGISSSVASALPGTSTPW